MPRASFPLAELAECSVKRVVVGDIAVAVVRLEGDDVRALGDVCSHANVSLSGGEVWCEERELECPQHGSTFDVETGQALTLPATQPVPVYRAEVDGDTVTVHVDEEAP